MNCSSYSKNAMVLKVRGYTRFLTHSHKLVKGLFYAPNGYIDLKTDTNFEGSMVAKQVMVHQGSGYNIKWDRFDFAGDNSSSGNTGGTGSITLHSDGDSQYESLP